MRLSKCQAYRYEDDNKSMRVSGILFVADPGGYALSGPEEVTADLEECYILENKIG